jgi:hypothetical protein
MSRADRVLIAPYSSDLAEVWLVYSVVDLESCNVWVKFHLEARHARIFQFR